MQIFFFGFHLTLLLKTVLKQLVYGSQVLMLSHFEQLSLLNFWSVQMVTLFLLIQPSFTTLY